MPANVNPRAELAPGHFLFTSESVGEGHPGMSQACNSALFSETYEINQTKFVTRSPTLS